MGPHERAHGWAPRKGRASLARRKPGSFYGVWSQVSRRRIEQAAACTGAGRSSVVGRAIRESRMNGRGWWTRFHHLGSAGEFVQQTRAREAMARWGDCRNRLVACSHRWSSAIRRWFGDQPRDPSIDIDDLAREVFERLQRDGGDAGVDDPLKVFVSRCS